MVHDKGCERSGGDCVENGSAQMGAMMDWGGLLHQLNAIGIRLSAEQNVDRLLDYILEECMNITASDGGSIYIMSRSGSADCLTFYCAKNRSREMAFESRTLPLDSNSFAGYCAITGEPLHFDDITETERLVGIRHNDFFDRTYSYQTRNMLVIPMCNYSGAVIGVLQLINKKQDNRIVLKDDADFRQSIAAYRLDEIELVTSLSSQAAILMERTQLFQEIEKLFKTFIESLVMALDKRDPATAGHSKRVADYAVALAKAVNDVGDGPYAELAFSDEQLKKLYYAGLLHDIGKVGVEERLLVKETRLSAEQLEVLRYRFRYMKAVLNLRHHQNTLSEEDSVQLLWLDRWLERIEQINGKGFVSPEEMAFVDMVATQRYIDADGTETPLLKPYEREVLSVVRGNLTPDERRRIERHPQMTYEVLREISWSKPLEDVPHIAACHHEQLDGKGYPEGLVGGDIPIMARILAIVDIFDAMTAKDRPYKRAVPLDKTLAVLQEEVAEGHTDADLTRIFIERQVYLPIYQEDVR